MLKRVKAPSPALAVSGLALFVALGGTGYAAATINGNDIKNKTIAGKKLKNKTVTAGKIKNGAISSAKLKNGAVTGAKIGSKAIDGSKVADNALGGAQINEAALGTVPQASRADSAASADRAGVSNTTDQLRGANGRLSEGQERVVISHGPLSILARCSDVNDNGNLGLQFFIASATAGSWFSSWVDGGNDLGPDTPEEDRALNASWINDSPGGGISYDSPADSGVSAAAANGNGFNAFMGGTADADEGVCRYSVTATITG